MTQLDGFVDPSKPQHICKLKKTLYRLKQALRAWFDRFKTTMISQWHFQNLKFDNSPFFKWDRCHIHLVLVYVDDITIIGSSSVMI